MKTRTPLLSVLTLLSFSTFAYSQSWTDCNGNGTLDATDIANGTSHDKNLDGRPDECNPHSQIVFEHVGQDDAHGRHAVVNDLNGDAVPDYAISEPQYDTATLTDCGRVTFYSGADASVLHQSIGFRAGMLLGTALDGGADLDGDGVGDILIGASGFNVTLSNGTTLLGAGAVFNLSGGNLSAAPLQVIYGSQAGMALGTSVCLLPDWNADTIPDLAVGAPFGTGIFGGNGVVDVYSGVPTYQLTPPVLISTFSGIATGPSNFGMSVITGGDADGGGTLDLLVGAPSQGIGGEAILISSETQAPIATIPGAQSVALTGQSLAFVGDQNGDGHSEFVIGSPRYNLSPVFTDAGRIDMWSYDPATGGITNLANMTGYDASEGFGFKLCPVRDITGDGRAEILVGAPGRDNPGQPIGTSIDMGAVYTISYDGSSFSQIGMMPGTRAGDRFGEILTRRVLEAGTQNGPRFLSGSNYGGLNGQGYAALVSVTLPPLGDYYCEPTQTSSNYRPSISAFGSTNMTAATGGLRLLTTGLPQNQFGIYYYGSNAIGLPFGNGFRCAGGGVNRLPVMNAGSAGRMELNVFYATPPTGWVIQPGMTRHFQCWFRDTPAGPGNFSLSDAVSLTFQ